MIDQNVTVQDRILLESVSSDNRKIQEERFKSYKGIYCNAMMTERMLYHSASLDRSD